MQRKRFMIIHVEMRNGKSVYHPVYTGMQISKAEKVKVNVKITPGEVTYHLLIPPKLLPVLQFLL